MVKEAMLYKPAEENKVECHLCAHRCRIKEGGRGICRVRENREGRLNTLVYGSVSSANVDPIEKKPLYHFHPGSLAYSLGTVSCNFRCKHCQNSSISFAGVGDVSTREFTPEKIVEDAVRAGCEGIAWTYNEPTVWFEFTYDTSKLAKERGLYTSYVTNGYMTGEALDVIAPYLDAANVDVKAYSEDFYKNVCSAKLEPVLRTCEHMKEKGIHIELTYLVIPGYNDDEAMIKEFAEWVLTLGEATPVHFSKYYPLHMLKDQGPTPLETLERACRITMDTGMKYVYIGNVAGHEYDNTHCPDCGELLIKRTGYSITDRTKGGKCPKCGRKTDVVR